MNKKLLFRLFIDFSMAILFLLLMSYPLSLQPLHEILGVVFTSSLVTHLYLNWRWYKSLNKGKYNLIRTLHTTVNLLLTALIIINIIAALGISQWLFLFLPIDWGITGRSLHILSAYWAMVILSIHIGFHWDMLMSITRKGLRLSPPNQTRTNSLQILTLIIATYGLYATYNLEIGTRLTAYYSYFFQDPNQSYFWLFLDYLTSCGLLIAITHYGIKRWNRNKNKQPK